MKKSNLFTIEFSDSEESDNENNQDSRNGVYLPNKRSLERNKNQPRHISPTVVTKRHVKELPQKSGTIIELSSESSDIESLEKSELSRSEHPAETVQANYQSKNANKYEKNGQDKNDESNSDSDIFIINESSNSKKNHKKSPEMKKTMNKNENKIDKLQEKEQIDQPNKEMKENQTIEKDDSKKLIVQKPENDENIKTENDIQVWKKYTVTREKKAHLNGRRLFFSLFDENKILYAAKTKTKNSKTINIKKGSEAHLSAKSDAIILVGNEGRNFSLRNKSNTGEEIITIKVSPPKNKSNEIRKMTINFFEPMKDTPLVLTSNYSKMKKDHNFKIKSIKNNILTEKGKDQNKLIIRRSNDNDLEIEIGFMHDELWAFAFGIASFLSYVK
ncbi:hypothetical protein TRFO_18133 [Tritrichomonas foetus]|uniref:Tubby C-terminal domain-containing protein n=1 Tax=Tritrichomonas foetus TaxID=1144522 RepID=A0A1J4KQZ4_9EUKA|nr:hypothetical protein TRFO_18133 [Tritrichomonas foetus]|eukprot:OHT12220.1 hypothetical protein TRFO_18133 [Tritrichomonas foetus]